MLQLESLIPHEVVSRLVNGATAIRAWREHLGMTQEDVAERLGICLSAYSQWEAAASLPADALERIASALCISLDQLSV